MDDFVIEEERKTPDYKTKQNSPQKDDSLVNIDEIANLTASLRNEDDDEIMQYTKGVPIPEQYQH